MVYTALTIALILINLRSSKLKVWSASVDDLNNWVCHGDIFHTRPDTDHESDTDWTDSDLYAPDVVEKDGKYYLYAYIMNAKGCVAVSDRPEGPFKPISTWQHTIPEEVCCNGWFIDPGVLVETMAECIFIAAMKSHSWQKLTLIICAK